MMDWLPSFCDELSKLAAEELTPAARARQYLQFGALGAGMGPLIGGLGNFIQRGEPTPMGVKVKRWLPAQMATGALIGGALPIMRDLLSRSNVAKVKEERAAHKLLQTMAPEGPEKALKKLQPKARLLEL